MLTERIAYACLAVGVLFALAGLYVTFAEQKRKKETSKEIVDAVKKSAPSIGAGTLQEQGAISDSLGSVAKIAEALKDLDTGTRLLVISVTYIAVAAVAAGLDQVAEAIAAAA